MRSRFAELLGHYSSSRDGPDAPISTATAHILHVDHRYSSAELEPRDQLEQKRCCGLPAGKSLIRIRFLVETEIPMGGNASEIEPAFRAVGIESIT